MEKQRIGIRKLTVSESLLDKMRKIDAAALYECMDKQGALDSSIQSISSGQRLCGYALTVRMPLGDNLMLHKAINMAKKNDVLVVECAMPNDTSAIGSMMALQAKKNGAEGFVIDGKVVDRDEIIKTGLPVYCTGTAIKGVTKNQLGWINCPVSVGGIVIQPGDIIVADSDGVVCVPSEQAEKTAEKALRRIESEKETIRRILAGEDLYTMKGFDNIFEKLMDEEQKKK